MRYEISICLLLALGWWGIKPTEAEDSQEGSGMVRVIQQKMEVGEYVEALAAVDASLFIVDAEKKPAMNPKWAEPKAAAELYNILSMRNESLNRLNRSTEIDAFLEKFIAAYDSSWRALQAAAKSYQSVRHEGRVVAGKFYRGNQQRNGEFASYAEHDRIRALQLLVKCIPLVQKDENSIDAGWFFSDFAACFMMGRSGNFDAWQMQDLSDVATLPDADTENPYGYQRGTRSTNGAPMNEDGTPLVFALPESFESAKNDGERWRWALEQMVVLNRGKSIDSKNADGSSAKFDVEAAFRAEKLNAMAQFSTTQFGTQTLQNIFNRMGEDAQEQMTRQGGILALETLPDTETVAQTAAGVKRFTLPDEYNYVKIYQELAAGPNRYTISSLQTLSSIMMNRRQFPRAVEYLKTILDTPVPAIPAEMKCSATQTHIPSVKQQIAQITGNWVRFEVQNQQTSENPTLSIRFRNAHKVSFRAVRVDVEKLYTAICAEIKAAEAKGLIPTNKQIFGTNINELSPESIAWQLVLEQRKEFLTDEISSWETQLEPLENYKDSILTLPLKVEGPGAYFVEMQAENGNRCFTMAWVFDTMILKKQLDGKVWYYVADARTGKAIPNAQMTAVGLRTEYVQSEKRRNADSYKVLMQNITASCDEFGAWTATPETLPENYTYFITARLPNSEKIAAFWGFNWNSIYFNRYYTSNYDNLTAFGISDRPVYRPEQTAHYKFWVSRAAYGSENYFESEAASSNSDVHAAAADGVDAPRFQPQPMQVRGEFEPGFVKNRKMTIRISDPNGEKIEEHEVTTDEYGAVSGDFLLAKDAKLGQYNIELFEENVAYYGNVTFRIEEYRKPEFEVKIDAPKEPVQLGDSIKVSIAAKYYFGAPVANGKIKYRVLRTTYDDRWYAPGPWDWLYGTGYWWFTCDYDWFPGWRRWGCEAPRPSWFNSYGNDEELVLEDEIELTPDMEGKAEITIETSLAAALYADHDHQYKIAADVEDASRRVITGEGKVLAARKAFKVNVWSRRGYAVVGDQLPVEFAAKTLDGKPVKASGIVKVFEISYDSEGTPAEKEIQTAELKTADDGTCSYLLKADHAGQFRVSGVFTSEGENPKTIEGAMILTIRGDGFLGENLCFNDLELIPDKAEYKPGETMKLLINTNEPNTTVVLFDRCIDGICSAPRYIQMEGKSRVVEIPIRSCDQPNFFIEAVTTAECQAYSVAKEICVPPEKRILNLEVEPSKAKYLPGEKAEMTLKLTGLDGKPFVGETVVTVYDKSVEYVSGGSNIGDIYAHFWNWKRYHTPRTDATTSLSSGNMQKPNEEGLQLLGAFGNIVMFGSNSSSALGGFGGAQANGLKLRKAGAMRRDKRIEEEQMEMDAAIAPMAMAAAPMMEAAAADEKPESQLRGVAAEDRMMDMDGNAKMERALETGGGEAKQAENPLVTATVRKNFADTAYWTASLKTDENGVAHIDFPMPESLTTWKVMAWAMADGTRVGKAETEVITAKNLILRMQTPRFVTTSDEIIFSANVHNYLETEKKVVVTLSLPEGAPCTLLDAEKKTVSVTIPANGESRVDWWVRAEDEGACVVTMSAQTDEESDAMELSVPVQIHGMAKQDARSGMISADAQTAAQTDSETAASSDGKSDEKSNGKSDAKTASGVMEFEIPEARRPKDSALEIRFSPTLAGAMLDAVPYLVEYPYGCTEQTLNRFLPAALVRKALTDAGVDLSAIAAQTNNLNAQEIGDAKERNAQWEKQIQNRKNDPVFNEEKLNEIVSVGVERLINMQCSDGGWGWFSGWGEYPSPHLTALVARGLILAQQAEVFNTLEAPNGAELAQNSLARGLKWLENYQRTEIEKLRIGAMKDEDRPKNTPYKTQTDEIDVLVFGTLAQAGTLTDEMKSMSRYIFRDHVKLSPQSNALAAVAFFQREEKEEFGVEMKYLTQFLVTDEENQTAHLSLPGFCWWWCWYGNDIETQAAYLRMLCLEGSSESLHRASYIVKYLLNNRKNATYWTSTRDTALVLEAFTQYLRTTNELSPHMTVEVLLDGKSMKTVEITPENLFTCDTTFLIEGEAVTGGTHRVELRRTGGGPLYFNGYARYFTLEQFIPKTGLEVKVERQYYRLERVEAAENAADTHGKLVKQNVVKYNRIPMNSGESVTSGDLVEVELTITSKNDYTFLLIEDMKPSGFETVDAKSGYNGNAMNAYVEYRDNRVAFFVQNLTEGIHSVSYRMRAETPGRVSALPTRMEAMYAPELKANSDEMKLECLDKPVSEKQ